jgi:hypothetical protein
MVDSSIIAPPTSAPESLNSTESKKMYDQWLNALNTHNEKALMQFYGDAVSFNGRVLDSQQIAKIYIDSLQKLGADNIQISGLIVDAASPNVRRAQFTQTLNLNGNQEQRSTLMLLENHKGIWKITAERDQPLNIKIEQKAPRLLEEGDIRNCDDAATAIFLSSPSVKQMLGDPKVLYKMEYKPDDPANPNKRYWFWIYMPHAKNTETYARYEVDPSTGKLYEYNEVTSDLKPAEYNRKLVKYMKQCMGK